LGEGLRRAARAVTSGLVEGLASVGVDPDQVTVEFIPAIELNLGE
jgi:hypothetical protein